MEQPAEATGGLYQVMLDCWAAEPGLRPSFTELAERMEEELREGSRDQVSSAR